jgi:hypothetical protein
VSTAFALGGAALACVAGGVTTANAAETGFYAGADAALVSPTVEKSGGANFGTPDGIVHVLPESARSEESELGWSGFVGYRVNPHLAVELAYLDFGSINAQEAFDLSDVFPGSDGPFTQDVNVQVTGPMASVMGIRWSVRIAYESVDPLRKTEFTGPVRLERYVVGVKYDF